MAASGGMLAAETDEAGTVEVVLMIQLREPVTAHAVHLLQIRRRRLCE